MAETKVDNPVTNKNQRYKFTLLVDVAEDVLKNAKTHTHTTIKSVKTVIGSSILKLPRYMVGF